MCIFFLNFLFWRCVAGTNTRAQNRKHTLKQSSAQVSGFRNRGGAADGYPWRRRDTPLQTTRRSLRNSRLPAFRRALYRCSGAGTQTHVCIGSRQIVVDHRRPLLSLQVLAVIVVVVSCALIVVAVARRKAAHDIACTQQAFVEF